MWSSSTAGGVCALHMAFQDMIAGNPDGPWSLSGVIPKVDSEELSLSIAGCGLQKN